MSSYDTALATDPEVADLIRQELNRQQTTLQLIASENFTSRRRAGRLGLGAHEQVLRGLPGPPLLRRQPHHRRGRGPGPLPGHGISSAPSTPTCSRTPGPTPTSPPTRRSLEPGATILAMRLDHGGHLTHGSPASIASKFWRFVSYGVTPDRSDESNPGEVIDFDQVAAPGQDASSPRSSSPARPPTPASSTPGPSGRSRTRSGRSSCSTPPTRPASSPAASTRARWAWPTSSPSPPTRRCAARAAGPSCAGRTWPRRSTARCSRGSRAARSSTSSRPRRSPSPRRRRPEFRDVRRAGRRERRRRWPTRWPGRGSAWSRAAPTTTCCSSTCGPSTPSSPARRPRRCWTGPASPATATPSPTTRARPSSRRACASGRRPRRRRAWGPPRCRSSPISSCARSRPAPTRTRSLRCAPRSPRCAPPSRPIPTSSD